MSPAWGGYQKEYSVPTFTPPVRSEKIPTKHPLFKHYSRLASFTVLWRNSHFTEVRYPAQEETDQLVEGVTWFPGGRTFTVSAETAALLEADGFTVT